MEGFAHRDFASVEETFSRQLERTDGGAAVTVFHRGTPVVDLWGGTRTPEGDPWEADTLAMCFSTTKGVASAALHLQAEAGLVDYDERVAAYWPEFAQNGKEDITVRHVLSHSAGLHRLRSVIDSAHHMLDWEHMVAAIAAEPPAYEPGTQCGYHALTYGWLVGEIVRRVTDRPLADVITRDVDGPLGLNGLYLGCPPDQRHRVAALAPMRIFGPRVPRALHRIRRGVTDQFGKALSLAGSPVNTRRMINALFPRGMEDVMAGPEVMDASIPAANGFFTARALATMYAVLRRRRRARRCPLVLAGPGVVRSARSRTTAAISSSSCRCAGGSATTGYSATTTLLRTASATSGSADRGPGPTRPATWPSPWCATGEREPQSATSG